MASTAVSIWPKAVITNRSLAARGTSTRGGRYVTGLYSVTSHEYFGRVTGAI